MQRLQKVLERILIALIIGFAILDVFIIGGAILSDVFGLHFNW